MSSDERIDKFHDIASKAMELDEEDFKAVEEMIREQKSYTHIFKNGTAKEINRIGEHNEKTLAAIKELKRVIVEENPFKQ